MDVPESDPQLNQIHPETNHAAQQVSYFFSTVTTPCNLDSTLSYGESGSFAVTCVCVESQTSYVLLAESLSCVVSQIRYLL